MQNKILTVIVPSYKTSKYMDECLPHFIHDKLIDRIVVYLIDDGSPDDSLQKAKEYEKNYPGLFCAFHKENGGHGSVINFGVDKTQTKYFKVIDGDDWPDTDSLIALVDYLCKCDDDIVISDCVGIFGEKTVNYYGASSVIQPLKTYDANIAPQLNPSIHKLTFKTVYYKSYDINLSEHVFYEDTEYSLLFWNNVKAISYFNRPVYFYRQGNVAQSTSIKSLINHFEDFKYVFSNILKRLLNITDNKNLNIMFCNCLSGSIRLWYLLIIHSNSPKKDKCRQIDELTKLVKNNDSLYSQIKKYKIIRLGMLVRFQPLFLFQKITKNKF